MKEAALHIIVLILRNNPGDPKAARGSPAYENVSQVANLKTLLWWIFRPDYSRKQNRHGHDIVLTGFPFQFLVKDW